jgi:hypothetical protein
MLFANALRGSLCDNRFPTAGRSRVDDAGFSRLVADYAERR